MEPVTILMTCWRLVRAISEVVDRVEQSREDARALKFLESQAMSFLSTVNQGLVGVDTSPYLGTVVSLEQLLNDILTASNAYIRMSRIGQIRNAAQTRRTVLDLNGRLRLFVDTYLLQTTTQAARVNLASLAGPTLQPGSNHEELIPDDVQWEIMSRSGSTSNTFTQRGQVANWMRRVGEQPLDEVVSNGTITSQPENTPPPTIPGTQHHPAAQQTLQQPTVSHNRLD